MVRHRHKPIITERSVLATLSQLRDGRGSEEQMRSLYALSLVEDVLGQAHFPPTERQIALHHALNRVFVSLITRVYAENRNIFGLSSPSFSTQHDEVRIMLHRDAQSGSRDLLAWSYLYHRHVRADLDFDKRVYAHHFNVSLRSLQRYEQIATRQFIDRLIEEEWMSRQVRVQQRLLAQIPVYSQQKLVERDVILGEIIQHFEQSLCGYVYLTGESGIGKTALCQQVIQYEIEQNQVDYLLWLTDIKHPEQIYDAIWAYKSVQHHMRQASLSEFMQRYRFFIVLDNLKIDDLALWDDIFSDMRFATVFITGRTYCNIPGNVFHRRLTNLSKDGVKSLIKIVSPHKTTAINQLYELSRGNPAQTLSAIHRLIEGKALTDSSSKFEQLTDAEKQICLLLSFFPETGVNLRVLRSCGLIGGAALKTLVRQGCISADKQQCYALTAHFLKNMSQSFTQISDFKQQLQQLILNIFNSAESDKMDIFRLYVCEKILSRYIDIPDEDIILKMVYQAWRIATLKGNSHLWERILRPYCDENHIELFLARSIHLRHLGHQEEALLSLQVCMQLCGQQGKFKLQPEILIEVARIHRDRGFYENALSMLQRAESFLKLYSSESGGFRLHQEKAQIALDRQDITSIRILIAQPTLFTDNPALYAELLLLNEDYHACKQIIREALEQPKELDYNSIRDAYHTGILEHILARCLYLEAHYDEALFLFMNALQHFEETGDVFAINRARTGLAATLIMIDEHEKAERLLQENLRLQAEVSDLPGLAATQHNFHVLTRIQALH